MRDYAKVSPLFWTGKTGKALKAAGQEAVIVGMYLMTSPHANMIGLYHCPLTYIAYDTGLTIEGASKGLLSAIEADFCRYDHDSEYVFVHEFAAYQIGDELDPKDKRVQGVINELAKVPKNQCWQGFRARYAVAFHLPTEAKTASPKKAPSKPLRSQKQEQEQEQNISAPDGFDLFWTAYPKKAAKPAAIKAFRSAKINGHIPEVLADIEEKAASELWTKAGGQFIPNPATYLNQRRWEDEKPSIAMQIPGLM